MYCVKHNDLSVTELAYRSANAAFGLGRAWATSGDKSRAIAEYRRALQLDPHHKRAADALKSLERS